MPLPALSSPTLADQAYDALRTAIVSGELGWGDKITERGLAAGLGVSPTPVREALRRLEQEQLVERTGPRTLRVTTVSAQTREECGQMEAALIGLAARFATAKATDLELAALGTLLDAADAETAALRADHARALPVDEAAAARLVDALRGFHAGVEQAAASPQLTRALEQLRAFGRGESRRIASARLLADPERLHGYADHRALLAALRAGDPDTAEHVARAHARAASAVCL